MNRNLQVMLFILFSLILNTGLCAEENKTRLTIYSTANANHINLDLYYSNSGNQEYNTSVPGYAIVYEQKQLPLKQGKNSISFPNMSSQIDPTTVMFKSLTDPSGTRIMEQNYSFELPDKKALLEYNLDKDIAVEQMHGDHITTFNGKLLNANESLILQDKSGHYISVQDYSTLRFSDLPREINSKPSLVWDINASKTANHSIELSYQIKGITWWADYNALYEEGKDPDAGFIHLNAWVTILNKSGVNFENANLKLIAGNVNQLQASAVRPMAYSGNRTITAKVSEENGFSEHPFFEYYIYDLNRVTSILNNTSKQIELFSNNPKIAVTKEYWYRAVNETPYYGSINMNPEIPGQKNKQIDIHIKFKNDKEQGLGIPLPAGRIRFTKIDKQNGTMEFIGENQIPHTAKNEIINIKIGSAFDLVGERKQINFSIDKDRHMITETFEITLKNHKDQNVEITVIENLYRGDTWKILDNNHDFTKINAHTIHFPVKINKDSEAKIRYTVVYTW